MSDQPLIAAFGAGRMGRGIAHVFAYAGYRVMLIDSKVRPAAAFEQLAQQARTDIERTLQTLAAGGLFEPSASAAILARIEILPLEQASLGLGAARYVFEGVPEVMPAKQAALKLIGELAPEDAIVASTTSTFLVNLLAKMIHLPQRFMNAHWLNPAYLIPLVELSPGQHTDKHLLEELKTLLEAIGKVPVVCAASPGYIVPRIQALAMNEAARLVEEGVASAEDIDKAIRYGFGIRFAAMGMLEFVDWGGGDILFYASRYLRETLAAERFRAPEIIEQNMREGHLGLRSGQGFYDYSKQDVEQYQQAKLSEFMTLLKHVGAIRPPVLDTD